LEAAGAKDDRQQSPLTLAAKRGNSQVCALFEEKEREPLVCVQISFQGLVAGSI